jgi:uncharacterized protein (TIGR03435 family)
MLTLCGLMNVPRTVAQSADASPPQFEVASIRRCDSDAGGRSGGVRSSPGRMVFSRQTLGNAARSFPGFIAQAYGLFANGHRNPPWAIPPVSGGPSWLDSDRYEIIAKAQGDPDQDMMNGPMLQTLLGRSVQAEGPSGNAGDPGI